MSEVFDVVLLNALPASGKSEVRNMLAHIDPKRLQEEFHIGDNLQLDDFPYVNFMRLIDEQCDALDHARVYYPTNDDPFFDGRDWNTLCQLLSEDYHDLMNRKVVKPDSYAQYMFDRLDRASLAAGLAPRVSLLPEELRKKIAEALEDEAKKMTLEKESQYPESFENKTIIIESARGGQDGASMPLTGTAGYQYYYPNFAPDLLDHAAILYIWVTPEESRRKNFARYNPDDPGSNLFHGTPLPVMMYDYGCDDMEYLRANTEVENTITVKAHDRTWHLPIGVFDNREDKTTFLREDDDKWDPTLVEEVTKAIKEATDTMWANYKK